MSGNPRPTGRPYEPLALAGKSIKKWTAAVFIGSWIIGGALAYRMWKGQDDNWLFQYIKGEIRNPRSDKQPTDTQRRLLTMIEEAEKRADPYAKHTAMREKYGVTNTDVDPRK